MTGTEDLQVTGSKPALKCLNLVHIPELFDDFVKGIRGLSLGSSL